MLFKHYFPIINISVERFVAQNIGHDSSSSRSSRGSNGRIGVKGDLGKNEQFKCRQSLLLEFLKSML